MPSENKDQSLSQTDLYEVSEVNEDTVTLKLVKNLDKDNKQAYEGAEFNVPKEKFAEKEINVSDRYKINHDDIIMPSNPAQFGTIYSIEKESEGKDLTNSTKEEKISQEFVVESVNESGYTIHELENEESKYIISKKDAKDLDLLEGDKIELSHNGIIMESYPAQFNKIYDIKKLSHKEKEVNKEEKVTEIFVVDEVNDGGYVISQKDNKDNKDNKYAINKEDLKGLNLKVGDKLEISHTGLATKSIPAQFVGDIEVKKINSDGENKDLEKDKENKNKIGKENKNSGKIEKDSNSKNDKKLNNEKNELNKNDKLAAVANKTSGSNPKTGVFSSMGILATAGAASILAKKSKK